LKDACVSHGISSVLKEKFEHSDAYKAIFCKNCQYLSNVNVINLDSKCPKCKGTDFGLVSMPYSFKLLIQDLSGAALMLKLKVKEKSDPEIDFLVQK
jgi:DNA-directed RNA polymerase beta subunit